jgi:hypothetical protein
MRPYRVTAVAVLAAGAFVLAGCGGDDAKPAAGDSAGSTTSAEATPEDSATPDETEDDTSTGDVNVFPEVDGFDYVDLPGPAFKSLSQSLKGTPELEGVEARLVEKNGEEAGLVMRIEVDADTAATDGFEDGFLPGFAGGLAGTSAKPDYEEIGGVNVVKIGTADDTGTAYAWLEDNIAVVIIFKDAADAQTFAEAALG